MPTHTPRFPCARCRQLRRVLSAMVVLATVAVALAWRLVWASPPAASAPAAAQANTEPASELASEPASVPPSPAASVASCRPAADAAQECAAAQDPLQLVVPFAYLPSGHKGKPYRSSVMAEGGRPGYRYRIVDAAPPPGLTLDAQGQLTGTPTSIGVFRFVVGARDSSTPPLEKRQPYLIRIHGQQPAPRAASQPAPSANGDAPALLRQASDNEVIVYQLRKEDVEVLMPDADAGTDASPAPAEAGAAPADSQETVLDPVLFQWLHEALTSMQGIEYPTQALFERALDARMAQAASAAADRPSAPQCRNCSVPTTLREAIVKAAQRRHDYKLTRPQQWEGGKCGCRLDDLTGELYGFAPFWHEGATPQKMDFSVLTRVGYFALPFDAFGNLPEPLQWSAAHADFIRVAHDHGTGVDLVLHRNRWDALLKLSDERLDHIAREVPRNAVRMIRTPMTGWRATLERNLPFFAREPLMGDGITVFFDELPTDADGAAAQRSFQRFFDTFVLALIEEMRRNGEPYALNLVIPAQAMGRGPFSFAVLAEYIKKAEEPLLEDGQIGKGGVDYRSRTNLTLRFLVPMPDPVTRSKRELRARIEEAPSLHGNDRRVFLRKVIPMLAADGRDMRQLGDDLVYFQDNFAGAAFWPVPPRGTPFGNALNVKLRKVYRQVDASDASPVCRFVCPRRWLLRLAFELLAVVGVVSLGAYALDCRVRRLGRKYLVFLFAGAVPAIGLGAALLSCDPALAAWRADNALLVILVMLVGWGALGSLRRRVERP